MAFARPSVVYVRATGGSGTGWVYKTGLSGEVWIMTNEHVVEDDAEVQIYLASGGGPYTGEVIGVDALRDLAVVRICCNSGLRASALAEQSEVRQGAEVIAFGYPYRAGVLSGLSVSDGIISSIGYYERRDSYTVQTTAESNPGNSGGPLVNMFGKVVGTIRSSVDFSPSGRPIDGIAFAVAARTIRDHLSALESGAGRVPTPTPTITPTPTPIPPPAIPPTPVPDNWDLVLVAVGDADQRHLDANERRMVADWLGVSIGDLPDIEAGYRLVSSDDEQNDEIIVSGSGIWFVTFAEVSGSFNGYKPWDIFIPVKIYGRVCRDGENCDAAVFRELSEFLMLDEDVGSGRAEIAPWIGLVVSLPAGYSIRIEVIAYYTQSGSTVSPTPTPTATPTPSHAPVPSSSAGELVIVAVGNSDQRLLNPSKRQVIGQSLQVADGQVSDVASGFRLTASNDQRDEVVMPYSGLYELVFVSIPSVFSRFNPVDGGNPISFFGRVCEGAENCDSTIFQNLKNYVALDEDVVGGTSEVTPWMRLTASVPAGNYLRIEMVAYYSSGQ